MRFSIKFIFVFFFSVHLSAQGLSVFINELNYAANNPTETGFEIVNNSGLSLDGYAYGIYNTSGTLEYIEYMSGVLPNNNEEQGYGWFEVDQSSGGGIALIRPNGTVAQFISYGLTPVPEGVDGPAAGMTPEYIGLQASPESSLQLTGTGSYYLDFIWGLPGATSPGVLNTNQLFEAIFRTPASDNQLFESIQVYPNPVMNMLNVQLSEPAQEGTSLTVFDRAGRLISYSNIAKNAVFARINFSQIEPGQYIIVIGNKQTSQSESIIKS